jgi:hypothetical protein
LADLAVGGLGGWRTCRSHDHACTRARQVIPSFNLADAADRSAETGGALAVDPMWPVFCSAGVSYSMPLDRDQSSTGELMVMFDRLGGKQDQQRGCRKTDEHT